MAGFTIRSNDLAGAPARQSVWYDTDIAILVAGVAGTGVAYGEGAEVTAQVSPDMTLAVSGGTVKPYIESWVEVTGDDVTIAEADATHPRIDLVSSSDAGVLTVTAGTPAASPKPPDLPAYHIALAMVDVPANCTAIEAGQITDKRVFVNIMRCYPLDPDTATAHEIVDALISAGLMMSA